MNYELAKKLKDAGFLQHGEGRESCNPSNHRYCVCEGKHVYYPTFSELIEACGGNLCRACGKPECYGSKNGFKELLRIYIGGEVNYKAFPILEEQFTSYKTPEEAVANLWLDLNSKFKFSEDGTPKKIEHPIEKLTAEDRNDIYQIVKIAGAFVFAILLFFGLWHLWTVEKSIDGHLVQVLLK